MYWAKVKGTDIHMKEIIIVGGGASGMMTAIFTAREGYKTTIIEHKDKLGKKLLATGNGKCNYTNLVQGTDKYHSDEISFPQKALELFTVDDTIEFFCKLGIYPKERNGYLYPYSEQASSVLSVLEMELKRLKVTIRLSEHVESIKKVKDKFNIHTNQGKLVSDIVILAAGGCASPNLGSDGSGYQLAKTFGHHIIKPLPALVQLVSKDKFLKTIQGVRCNGLLQVFSNGKVIAKEQGELLFANYGISGIPVLQISRFVSKELDKNRKVEIEIDFIPELTGREVSEMVTERIKSNGEKTLEEMMIGLLNHKLSFVLLKEGKLNIEKFCRDVSKEEINRLVDKIKGFRMNITGTNAFEQAQVSCGGVDTREVSGDTLESKLVKGLYFTGEILDVDGTCGGYNLQWAWSSGVAASKGITNKNL